MLSIRAIKNDTNEKLYPPFIVIFAKKLIKVSDINYFLQIVLITQRQRGHETESNMGNKEQ